MSDLGHHRAAERADPVDARLRAFAATTPSRLDVPLSEAYSRSGGGGELLAAVRALLALGGVSIGPPGPRDYVVLLRGMPVAPWMRLRPAADVWGTWLQRLEELWLEWRELLAAPPSPAPPLATAAAERLLMTDGAQAWESWQAEHVMSLQARHALVGTQQLAKLLADERLAHADIHLVGHSVGGATVLAYLAGCRSGAIAAPPVRIRAAITLDAAVSGLAGVWSGVRQYLGARAEAGLQGLGDWAQQHDIGLLTATNERDVWSHRAIADLPYLGLRLGPPFALRAQVDGTIHGWLRRTPQLVEALWGLGAANAWTPQEPARDAPLD